ncbi:class I SAM-dependent methyltransferase [Pontimicrobium aquaticum]|uniref:Methyltransferase domain-containing protein n=1 Tax=Pontimicrobium aquaticum TaxID=2565367 RepID=A0A4U0EWP7_9FLAO|nr:rRNA adenine N-6-methyltransferase family protein [Pontimicrobium aquaticum]TJY36208.1 methyltransferase domain-containing protein [Pontimicrobium aquaticum]
MKLFVKEVVNSMKHIGAIAPSSKYLANNIIKHINFDEDQIILEFGCGNGAITKQILKQMPSSSRLISLEINDPFMKHCQDRFKIYNNFEVYNHSAIEFDLLLQELKIEKVDYLISSLPLAILPKADLDILFKKIPEYLITDGSFVQYQYSLNKYKYLKSVFDSVKLGFTPINLPPAFVYRCS